jgi:hypothetical protein
MSVPQFTVIGSPRTQRLVTVQGNREKVSTKAGFRQFEWLAKVILKGSADDTYEVGTIQNMMEHSLDLWYGESEDLTKAHKKSYPIAPLPILDSREPNAVWYGGQCKLIGRLPYQGQLPSAISNTSMEVAISTGDDPGGRFRVWEKGMPSRLLRKIDASHKFITWLAVRRQSAPARVQASYQFLKYAVWTVKRVIVFTHQPSGWGYRFIQNTTRIDKLGDGMGAQAPKLTGKVANKSLGDDL